MKLPYDRIPLIPTIVAETVAEQPLPGFSELEDQRQRLTPDEVREFVDLCEARCRASYEANGLMLQIAQMPGEAARDELAYWIRQWLVSYLRDPRELRRCKEDPQPQK